MRRDGEGVEWVVDLELAHEARGTVVDKRREDSDADRASDRHAAAAGSDSDETAQDRVACVADLEDTRTAHDLGKELFDQ